MCRACAPPCGTLGTAINLVVPRSPVRVGRRGDACRGGCCHPVRITGKRMLDAALDVIDQNRPGGREIPRQGAFEQLLMLVRCNFTAEDHRDHLVAEILVVDGRVRIRSTLDPQAEIKA